MWATFVLVTGTVAIVAENGNNRIALFQDISVQDETTGCSGGSIRVQAATVVCTRVIRMLYGEEGYVTLTTTGTIGSVHVNDSLLQFTRIASVILFFTHSHMGTPAENRTRVSVLGELCLIL